MSDIKLTRGDDLTFDIYVTRGNPEVPVILTGAKIYFTIKKTTRDDDADALIEKNSTDNPTECRVLDDIAGIIRVHVPGSETDDLPVSYLPYDVQVKEADGNIVTPEKGFVEVERDSTITTS